MHVYIHIISLFHSQGTYTCAKKDILRVLNLQGIPDIGLELKISVNWYAKSKLIHERC